MERLVAFACGCVCLLMLAGCSGEPEGGDYPIRGVVFHEICPETLKGPCASPDYFRDVLTMLQLADADYLFASEAVAALDAGRTFDRPTVMLTFDDAEPGVRDYAHPLIESFGAKATYFINTQGVNEGRPRCLGWDDVRTMQDSGHWEFHSHGHAHPYYIDLPADELSRDMTMAVEELHSRGVNHPLFLAYPFGLENETIRTLARQAGYTAGFIAGPLATLRPEHDRFALPRTSISQVHTQELVCRKLGIDLEAIRERLIIIDESEGTFTGDWEHFEVPLDAPSGQYGTSYAVAKTNDVSWSCRITITHPGEYHLSLWFPEHEWVTDRLHRQFRWHMHGDSFNRIKREGGGQFSMNTVQPNAWNPWNGTYVDESVPFNFTIHDPGTFTFTFTPIDPMLIDAFKIEWASEPRVYRVDETEA